MCGLVGVIGDIWDADKRAFEYMLKLDTVRGHHSTGIARVYENDRNKFDLIKEVGTPWDLLNSKGKEYYNGSNSGTPAGAFIALMGHNRWATVGNINADNAHPFNSGNIIGAHNGTLPQHHRSKLEDFQHYETDSEAIMFNFDKNGVKDTISKIDGAWALTWYNIAEGTFNVLRNKERPLYYAWKDNGRTLFYASEPEFIYMAADRFNIKLKKVDGDEVFSFKENQWYKYKIEKVMNFSAANLEKEEVKGWTFPTTGRTIYRTNTTTYTTTFPSKKASDSASVFMSGSYGSSSAASSTSKWQDFVKRKGQRIEFSIGSSIYLDEQKKEYIPGRVVNDGAMIRVYDSVRRPDLFTLLGDTSVLTFTGVLKKVKVKSNSNSFYLTLDPDSVQIQLTKSWATKNSQVSEALSRMFDDEKQKEDESKVYKIGTNRFSTLEGFKRAVHHGCCWCSYVPEPEDHNDVLWYNAETFLCKDCAKDESTVKYTALYAQN